jgi:hypothetical protein
MSYSGINVSILTDNTNKILTFSAATIPAGAGEANTASNVGSANGLYYQKSGVDLQFRSLSAGTNISITSGATTLTINSTATGGSSRSTATTATSDATLTTAATISTLATGATIVQAFVTAKGASGVNFGTWRRTLGILYTGSTITVGLNNADMDYQVGGNLNPSSVSFNSVGSDLYLAVSGVSATNITWYTSYEII